MLKPRDRPRRRSRRWLWRALAVLPLAGLVWLFWPQKVPDVPPQWQTVTSSLPAGGLNLDSAHNGTFGIEYVPLGTPRMDVYRDEVTTTDADGDTDTELAEHCPHGVYLGRGYFFDAHRNLSLLPERAFKERSPGPVYKTLKDLGHFWWFNETVQSHGTAVTGNWAYLQHRTPETIQVGTDFGVSIATLTRRGSVTEFSFPFSHARLEFQQGGEHFQWGHEVYEVFRKPTEISVDGPIDHKLSKTDDGYSLEGPGGYTVRIFGTITRTEGSRPTRNIWRDGNRVRIEQPGQDTWVDVNP